MTLFAASRGSLLAALAGALAWTMMSGPVFGQALDPETVATCLFDNSSDEDVAAMKKVIVAGIREEASLKTDIFIFTSRVVTLATGRCNIAAEQLETPAFQAAMTLYGNKVGAKVMQDAFAKMK